MLSIKPTVIAFSFCAIIGLTGCEPPGGVEPIGPHPNGENAVLHLVVNNNIGGLSVQADNETNFFGNPSQVGQSGPGTATTTAYAEPGKFLGVEARGAYGPFINLKTCNYDGGFIPEAGRTYTITASNTLPVAKPLTDTIDRILIGKTIAVSSCWVDVAITESDGSSRAIPADLPQGNQFTSDPLNGIYH